MPGYPLPEYDVVTSPDGSIDPYKHLFRASFYGVDKGPMISQVPYICDRSTRQRVFDECGRMMLTLHIPPFRRIVW